MRAALPDGWVYLGTQDNFDYHGNPATGWVRYAARPGTGCNDGSFGDRLYWRSMLAYWTGRDGPELTEEGRAW